MRVLTSQIMVGSTAAAVIALLLRCTPNSSPCSPTTSHPHSQKTQGPVSLHGWNGAHLRAAEVWW